MNLKYGHTTISASAALTGIPTYLMGVTVAPAGSAVTVQFTDDATGLGTPLFTVYSSGLNTFTQNLIPFGGIKFPNKLYCKITGTAAVTIWHD